MRFWQPCWNVSLKFLNFWAQSETKNFLEEFFTKFILNISILMFSFCWMPKLILSLTTFVHIFHQVLGQQLLLREDLSKKHQRFSLPPIPERQSISKRKLSKINLGFRTYDISQLPTWLFSASAQWRPRCLTETVQWENDPICSVRRNSKRAKTTNKKCFISDTGR